MQPPFISLVVLYLHVADFFAAPVSDPISERPSPAIVTFVFPPMDNIGSVNLTIFPDGRQPVLRSRVKHYSEAGPFEPAYKLQTETTERMTFYVTNTIEPGLMPTGRAALYYTGELANGTIVYTDYELTTPYTGTTYVVKLYPGGGGIYSVSAAGALTYEGELNDYTFNT